MSAAETTEAPVIAVEGLSVRYGRTQALEDVSLSVPRGAIFALLGRNGAGKSSLVRCLLGQQKPTQGRARLFGQDTWTTRARAMKRVGVVPEEPDAPPEMTARELGGVLSPALSHLGRSGLSTRASAASTSPGTSRSRASPRGRRGR